MIRPVRLLSCLRSGCTLSNACYAGVGLLGERMKDIRILSIAAACLCVCLASGCGAPESDTSGAATGVAPAQANEVPVGVSFNPPEEWYALDEAATSQLMDFGLEVGAPEDKTMRAAAAASGKRTTPLFAAFKYPPGEPVEFNPSLMGALEDVSMVPGVKSGRDYFFHARRMLEQSPIPYTFADEYGAQEIGGRTFDRMDLSVNVSNLVVHQSYYAARSRDKVILIIASYSNEEQQRELAELLEMIELDG